MMKAKVVGVAILLVFAYLEIYRSDGWLQARGVATASSTTISPKPSIFFLANDLRDFVVANVQMASLYNPGTPIYVITSCDQFEQGRGLQLEQLLSLPLVRLKLIENHLVNATDAAAFADAYWPHSLTSFEFGLFNFQRFFVIRDIAREEGLARFWQVDFDMAPEVIRYENYDEKCDVYSFGILLNELMTGHPPYLQAYLSPVQVARGVADDQLRPHLVKEADPRVIELIEACWANEASARPAFGHVTTALRKIFADVGRSGKHPLGSDGHEHHGVIGRLFHKSA